MIKMRRIYIPFLFVLISNVFSTMIAPNTPPPSPRHPGISRNTNTLMHIDFCLTVPRRGFDNLIGRFGFDVAHYREMTPRTEGGAPVPGQLIALVKRSNAARSFLAGASLGEL